MNTKFLLKGIGFLNGLVLLTAMNSAYSEVCGRYQGQQICTNSAQQWSQVTGQSMAQSNLVQTQYNKDQAVAKARAEQEAAARAASYAAAQHSAAVIHTQNAQNQAALAAAQIE